MSTVEWGEALCQNRFDLAFAPSAIATETISRFHQGSPQATENRQRVIRDGWHLEECLKRRLRVETSKIEKLLTQR